VDLGPVPQAGGESLGPYRRALSLSDGGIIADKTLLVKVGC